MNLNVECVAKVNGRWSQQDGGNVFDEEEGWLLQVAWQPGYIDARGEFNYGAWTALVLLKNGTLVDVDRTNISVKRILDGNETVSFE